MTGIERKRVMVYSRILEAGAAGAVHVDLEGHNSDIEVSVDDGCRRARIEVWTEANSGVTVEEIDKLCLRERAGTVELHLPAGVGGSSVVMVSGGGSFSSVMSYGGGDTDMVVNGQRIQVRGGKTYVNGVAVDGGVSAPAGDPPAQINLRALLPAGSSLRAVSHNGRVVSDGVGQVTLRSHNGKVKATGLTEDSKVKSHNADVTVGAAPGHRPAVVAETHNGDVRVLDDDIRARPRTHNGDVRYPR